MKLKKCLACEKYTLKQEHCTKQTKDAHYKFIKIKSLKPSESSETIHASQ